MDVATYTAATVQEKAVSAKDTLSYYLIYGVRIKKLSFKINSDDKVEVQI